MSKKVLVLVESQYIPSEIRDYQDVFANADVDMQLFSRLWGNRSATFVSEVEEAGRTPQTIVVSNAVERFFLPNNHPDRLELSSYKAILMSANYTSVRLRHWGEKPGEDDRPEDTPAVKLFANAMEDEKIVKGALCHGLWILCPRPDLMRGRRVICHPVVYADIVNAGAHVDLTKTLVVDKDLVTGKSYKEARQLAEQIVSMIV